MRRCPLHFAGRASGVEEVKGRGIEEVPYDPQTDARTGDPHSYSGARTRARRWGRRLPWRWRLPRGRRLPWGRRLPRGRRDRVPERWVPRRRGPWGRVPWGRGPWGRGPRRPGAVRSLRPLPPIRLLRRFRIRRARIWLRGLSLLLGSFLVPIAVPRLHLRTPTRDPAGSPGVLGTAVLPRDPDVLVLLRRRQGVLPLHPTVPGRVAHGCSNPGRLAERHPHAYVRDLVDGPHSRHCGPGDGGRTHAGHRRTRDPLRARSDHQPQLESIQPESV